ncbi:ABC transporter ATP-binding protein [Ornithinicoccus halotolerans]|uniref:ABC transporter ATP-binding protein n=1 Tax=Ornithinicoccus halotolerans TaxID=1748220 RepID=UPI001294F02F|nr:ABC transporter ATP-binding protein [Ornithinicoccus halotolerans]
MTSTRLDAPPATRPGARLAASAVDLTRSYGRGDAAVTALGGVSVGIEAGRFTAVMGPSGSGKSTLMHLLAGLDSPSSGRVFLGDTELTRLRDTALTRLRRERVGFVFQSFNLVPTLTAGQNIDLPLRLAGASGDRRWRSRIVAELGLGDRLGHRPGELSGGQQQRVALARALVTRPDLVLADEPTGSLDSRTGSDVLALLRRSVDEWGRSVVMVTHDPAAAAWADRVLLLADGRLAGELLEPTAGTVLARLEELRVSEPA